MIRLAGTVLLAALAACASPDLGPRPDLAADAPAASRTFAGQPDASQLGDRWWDAYGDAQLSRLIDEALAGSPSLAAAAARLQQAMIGIDRAVGEAGPSFDALGSVQEVRQSLNNGYPAQFKSFLPKGWHDQGRVSAHLNYQLDFFGRNRAALAAATSSAEAARAEAAAARLTLSTAVAGAYADLAQLYAERDALTAEIDVRAKSADLLQQRFRQGLETREPAARAEAGVASARTDLAALDGRIGLVRNQLAALMGKGPDRGQEITRPSVGAVRPLAVPATLAADLVGRRPDIAAARARAQATGAREDQAKAEFYPNINFAAVVGLQSLPASLLLQNNSQFGSVGPAISLPIFGSGGRQDAFRGSRAAYQEAAADYSQAVVQAYREVADALTQRRAIEAELASARAAVAARREARAIAGRRFDAGLERMTAVLDTDEELLAARRRVAGLEASAFNTDVALIRALGGGYLSPAESPLVAHR